MGKISLKVITLERTVYQDEVDAVTLPTQTGVITVLPNHAPLVSLVASGLMTIKKGEDRHEIAVTGGFFEVRPGSQLVIMADSADRAEEMDLEEIRQAKERVEKLLAERQQLSDIEFAHLQEVLGRELSRLDIASKLKNRQI